MFRTAAKDIELACDEDVIRTLGTDERRGYAKTLILTEAGGNELLFSDLKTNTIEERIVAIMKYKKLSAVSAAIAAVIAVSIALCAFTKPVAKENEEIVRTTARQKPNVTCEETYVRDSNDHMRRTYGYVMASSTDVVQYDDERSGTYVYPDYFAALMPKTIPSLSRMNTAFAILRFQTPNSFRIPAGSLSPMTTASPLKPYTTSATTQALPTANTMSCPTTIRTYWDLLLTARMLKK
jgi:hypothetical protein